jgi:hypothetical protein
VLCPRAIATKFLHWLAKEQSFNPRELRTAGLANLLLNCIRVAVNAAKPVKKVLAVHQRFGYYQIPDLHSADTGLRNESDLRVTALNAQMRTVALRELKKLMIV